MRPIHFVEPPLRLQEEKGVGCSGAGATLRSVGSRSHSLETRAYAYAATGCAAATVDRAICMHGADVHVHVGVASVPAGL
eukprot:261993-Chlamydomonas_euryale.AAC.1